MGIRRGRDVDERSDGGEWGEEGMGMRGGRGEDERRRYSGQRKKGMRMSEEFKGGMRKEQMWIQI